MRGSDMVLQHARVCWLLGPNACIYGGTVQLVTAQGEEIELPITQNMPAVYF